MAVKSRVGSLAPQPKELMDHSTTCPAGPVVSAPCVCTPTVLWYLL